MELNSLLQKPLAGAESDSNQYSDSAIHTQSASSRGTTPGQPRSETRTPAKARKNRNKGHTDVSHRPATSQSHELNGAVAVDHRSRAPSATHHAIDTPAKPAYAGPTFHASPAAASLPMPKFLSKSAPPIDSPNSLQARLDPRAEQHTGTPSDSEGPTTRPSTGTESPLDFLFSAHKQEQARGTHAGRYELAASRSPTTASPTPALSRTRKPATPNHAAYQQAPMHSPQSAKHAMIMESDLPNHPSQPIDITNIRSFQDRLTAMRSSATPPADAQADRDEAFRQSKTAELKKLLFMQPGSGSAAAQTAPMPHASPQHQGHQLPMISPGAMAGTSERPITPRQQPGPDGAYEGLRGSPQQPERQYIPQSPPAGVFAPHAHGTPPPHSAQIGHAPAYHVQIPHAPSQMPRHMAGAGQYVDHRYPPQGWPQGHHAHQQYTSPQPKGQAQPPSGMNSPANGSTSSPNVKSMEDSLRRILKLDGS